MRVKDWRLFWKEVVTMWARIHGFTLEKPRSAMKWTGVATILGLIALAWVPPDGRLVLYIVTGAFGSSLLVSLLFYCPFIVYEPLIPLKKLKDDQHSNEYKYLWIVVNDITSSGNGRLKPSFVIHSGLLYDIKPEEVLVCLVRKGQDVGDVGLDHHRISKGITIGKCGITGIAENMNVSDEVRNGWQSTPYGYTLDVRVILEPNGVPFRIGVIGR